ncbi:MAG TPA: hypothetical protein VHB77_22150 [Planctomycetaceae bacterium]|nr:hypothetical protein [Planctomycetaceae bacterium]
MGTSREITERQLQDAKAAVQRRVAALEKSGVDREGCERDPQWRRLDAHARQVNARLRKIRQVESLDAELARLKQEKAAAAEAEAAAPAKEEAPKKKKEKAPKAAKGADAPKKQKSKGKAE